MAIFDLTDTIIWGGRPAKEEMISWLSEHVGEYYGHGDQDRNVIAIGAGWEIRVTRDIEPFTDDLVINWIVDITDDAKSTHFALVWIDCHKSITK